MDRKRVFVVGCSRSGTSIVQKKVSEEFNLWTLPETAYFLKERVSIVNRLEAFFNFSSKRRGYNLISTGVLNKVYLFLKFFLSELYLQGVFGFFSSVFSRRGDIVFFLRSMDKNSIRSRSNGWVEKTPMHFYCIDEIVDRIPSAKIIFVLRDPVDTIASIIDRSIRYPDRGFEHQLCPSYGVKIWNDSVKACKKYIDRSNVLVITYGGFCENLSESVSDLSSFVGLNKSAIKKKYQLASDDEVWKSGLSSDVKVSQSKREAVLSAEQITYINNNVDWLSYREILEKVNK